MQWAYMIQLIHVPLSPSKKSGCWSISDRTSLISIRLLLKSPYAWDRRDKERNLVLESQSQPSVRRENSSSLLDKFSPFIPRVYSLKLFLFRLIKYCRDMFFNQDPSGFRGWMANFQRSTLAPVNWAKGIDAKCLYYECAVCLWICIMNLILVSQSPPINSSTIPTQERCHHFFDGRKNWLHTIWSA